MPSYELDAADQRILRELQQDGASRNDLFSKRLTPALRRAQHQGRT